MKPEQIQGLLIGVGLILLSVWGGTFLYNLVSAEYHFAAFVTAVLVLILAIFKICEALEIEL